MIDTSQWRATIGIWNCCRFHQHIPVTISKAAPNNNSSCNVNDVLISHPSIAIQNIKWIMSYFGDHQKYFRAIVVPAKDYFFCKWVWRSVVIGMFITICSFVYFMMHTLLLLLSGDIELNPGPIVEQVFKDIDDSLRDNYSGLRDATKFCIDNICSELYSKRFITAPVNLSKNFESVFEETKVSLQHSENIQKLMERYELFLKCLSRESGPVKEASEKLTREWNNIKQKFALPCDGLQSQHKALFTKDSVYHASLCNLVLSIIKKPDELQCCLNKFRHSFINMSVSGKTKVLIAYHENGDIYISFKSTEEDFSESVITKELPLKFFCWLLNQGKRLIFTGYSFGALAASSIVVKMWNEPYSSSSCLKQCVACIMFGHPPVKLVEMKEAASSYQRILQSFHSFILEEELQIQLHSRTSEKTDDVHKFDEIHFRAITYLIHQSNDGLICTKAPSDKDICNLKGCSKIEFTMEHYFHKVLRSHIDEPDGDFLPPKDSRSQIPSIDSLEPEISKIEFHLHSNPDGKEFTVVIFGDNLWFLNAIEIDSLKINVSTDIVAQKKICYNCTNIKMPSNIHVVRKCRVKAFSKFADPFSNFVIMDYYEEGHISLRQGQLAKQTPSQIIRLSFLSALLEKTSSSNTGTSKLTKRCEKILEFLNKASSIVPMESVFFAFANTESPIIAMKIFESIKNAEDMPLSEMTLEGMKMALRKLTSKPYQKQQSTSFDTSSPSYQNPSSISPYELRQEHKEYFCEQLDKASHAPDQLLSEKSIGDLYPIADKAVESECQSQLAQQTPLTNILCSASDQLKTLTVHHQTTCKSNTTLEMLKIVNTVWEHDLSPCIAMLGGFMEQQIQVPLVCDPKNIGKALRNAEDCGSIGMWALFALEQKDIKNILSSRNCDALFVQVSKFVGCSDIAKMRTDTKSTTSYDAKLQFLLQALNKTVTCSSNYVSYSLERLLLSMCKKFNISTSSSIDFIVDKWDTQFEGTNLALIPLGYRRLLASWLIWGLNIHELRNSLAAYTTVGIVGLVNSGKSTLVHKVFNVKTVVGSSHADRTTIPLVYSFDDSVEGFNVIDFPGVNDTDKTIGDLAKLLVELAQVIILVVKYDHAHTNDFKNSLKFLMDELVDVPTLICLSHADQLYANIISQYDLTPQSPSCEVKTKIDEDFKDIKKAISQDNCKFMLCSLTQPPFSEINTNEVRECMKNVGIADPKEIAKWICNELRHTILQPTLADKLEKFFATIN